MDVILGGEKNKGKEEEKAEKDRHHDVKTFSLPNRFARRVKRKVRRNAPGSMAQTLMKGMASAPESGAVTTKVSLHARKAL